MASSLPYLSSNKNVERLFAAIASAKVPDRFTQEFLGGTIGLKGSNDRQAIPLLRTLKFIDQSGAPTQRYRLLKSPDAAKAALADGIRDAYAPLFASNEDAHALPNDKLRGLVAQVAGTDDGMTSRIVLTFAALARLADFSARPSPRDTGGDVNGDVEEAPPRRQNAPVAATNAAARPMRPEFHYNIQVHLPNNATEEVYLNIFNALRKTFQ
ncbi:MAG: hypothetical protein JWP65_2875 [Ramlibacter sp.]|jgi:hypothetical protein|uniref:DUF5343 domain-containing protein n=1 Tax=Ramlibacter sp. TaxID=1917967 RepID=UPI002617B7A2|nr:DUF5343 domain-containing protein [Ramlibacter sp.]MDB5752454.1 hypothetical protein [Ramlibacter sp.]